MVGATHRGSSGGVLAPRVSTISLPAAKPSRRDATSRYRLPSLRVTRLREDALRERVEFLLAAPLRDVGHVRLDARAVRGHLRGAREGRGTRRGTVRRGRGEGGRDARRGDGGEGRGEDGRGTRLRRASRRARHHPRRDGRGLVRGRDRASAHPRARAGARRRLAIDVPRGYVAETSGARARRVMCFSFAEFLRSTERRARVFR